MIILRDEKRINRLRKVGQYASLFGMALLLGGLVIAFTNVRGDPAESGARNVFTYQLLALILGWLISQVGIFLAQRYARNPRPDQVIDEAIKKVAHNGRIYHYLLPAPHVLLLPNGIIIFVSKFQTGNITANGDQWKQKGIGLRKFFGQEGLGNPTREAETMVQAIANYIHKHAPGVENVPIGVIIVFTTKGLKTLDVKDSRVPAMHYSKVKGFLREQKRQALPLPAEDYEAIRAAFDLKATHLIEIADENLA